MADDRDDLEERVEELEATLRELRDEMRRPPRGPMGFPRPPTPQEVLRFTGEYGIPTAIAVLEANLRALEMLQRVLRYVDPADATSETGDELGSRAQRASRATLDRLESSLGDLEDAIAEGDLPRESAARNILQEARRLNEDIRDELSAGREQADAASEPGGVDTESAGADATDESLGHDAVDIAVDDESEDGAGEDDRPADDRPEVDVDAELESIRDELEERDESSVGVDEADAESRDADDEGSNAGSADDADS